LPISITLELSDPDLDYFRRAMRDAQAKTRRREEPEIVDGARMAARQMRSRPLPAFVSERLQSLDTLTRMLEDADWQMKGPHRARVLQALAYFAEPGDLVPDQIPGLGLLDDAIMVELVVQELGPELETYAEFCAEREQELARQGSDPAERGRRIAERRRAMYARMQERRNERARRGFRFSIFG
jgi:uncharacterized membrane protein YkvA (DUF1232 family)